MPIFRYIINNGTPSSGAQVVDFPDVDAAKDHAVLFAGGMLAEIDGAFWQDSEWRLDVADEFGLILCSIIVLGLTSVAGQPQKAPA